MIFVYWKFKSSNWISFSSDQTSDQYFFSMRRSKMLINSSSIKKLNSPVKRCNRLKLCSNWVLAWDLFDYKVYSTNRPDGNGQIRAKFVFQTNLSFLITGVVVMMVGFVFLIYFWFVVYISFKQRNGIQTHVLRNSNIYGIYVVNYLN